MTQYGSSPPPGGNNVIALGQAHHQLIAMNLSQFVFLHKLFQRMNFKHVYLLLVFLELFIGKFISNINNECEQDYSCPVATFVFCSHGEKLPWQGLVPAVVQ